MEKKLLVSQFNVYSQRSFQYVSYFARVFVSKSLSAPIMSMDHVVFFLLAGVAGQRHSPDQDLPFVESNPCGCLGFE